MQRYADLQNTINRMHTCLYCGLTGVHPKGRFCPAYGKRCYRCKKFNHFAFICKSSRDKRANIRGVKCQQEEHTSWIKHLTKDANEIEEDSDDSADEEVEARLAEHMKMFSHPGKTNHSNGQAGIQRRITTDDTRANWIKKDLSTRQEKTHRQVENVALFEQINKMQKEIKHIKSELAVIEAENTQLRKNLLKQRKELDKCQITINKLHCIIQQQRKEIDDFTLRTESCESIGGDHQIAEELVNTAGSEVIEIERKSDNQTEEVECGENEENDMSAFNNRNRRNHERLTPEDRHFISSTLWLKEEAEDLTIFCQDLQARLRCIIRRLDDEQESRLDERQFDHTQILRQYDEKSRKGKL